MPKLGIIGGGQLGRMLTSAALELGLEVICIDPSQYPPAVQVGARHILAELDDPRAIGELLEFCDVVTWEIEHISTKVILQEMNKLDNPARVEPNIETLELIKDKFVQKSWLVEQGVKVADFREVKFDEDISDFLLEKKSVILKKRFDGFDGRGNYIINSIEDISPAYQILGSEDLYVEEKINLNSEVAIILAKGSNDQVMIFDPVDTVHSNNICNSVAAPSKLDPELLEEVKAVALKVSELLKGFGVYAIEMFISSQGEVLVNEIAPRVHNSGHHTIEACVTSQFEQHIRAVMGWSLGDPSLKVGSVAMVNILGQSNSIDGLGDISDLLLPDIKFHWYGKSPVKIDRKMGHITVTSNETTDYQFVLNRAQKARKELDL